MKKLIFIGGTMGVGKTAASKALLKLAPKAVMLDGDWCWYADPFTVNESTKAMVQDNIVFLLQNFLNCPEYETVIFCWVMHQQEIADGLVSRLLGDFSFYHVSLFCSEEELRRRIFSDAEKGLRQFDDFSRSRKRLPLYQALSSQKLDVSSLTVEETALKIAEICKICR